MNNLTITRAGIIGAAPHRYIDILSHPKINKFKFYFFDNEKDNFNFLYSLYKKTKVN